ncbi:MAG: hypothetical protein QW767_00735 [Thermoprotei archaeon]
MTRTGGVRQKSQPPEPSRKELLYLKAIANQGHDTRLIDLSRSVGVASPSALEELRHLEAKGFVENTRGLISLTKRGRNVLKAHSRVHIAFETLLAEHGVQGPDVCEGIHEFDFALPMSMASKVYKAAGRPRLCPDGHSEC